MRKHYAGRENEMPYKTLAGFRRARRAQSKEYLDNRRTWINKAYPNNKKPLTNNIFSGRIEESISLPDEIFPRSVGAKWANYDIPMPDGTIAHFQEGSKLHHKEVFAGNGCKRKIDEVDLLVDKFGGTANEWQKIKAIGTIVRENGEIEEAEIHWYEEPSVGKVKIKYKKRI